MSQSPLGWIAVIVLGFVGAMAGLVLGFYGMHLLGSSSVEIPVTTTLAGATVSAWLTMQWLERRKRAMPPPADDATLRASFRRRYWATLVASAATMGTAGWMFFSRSDEHAFFSGVGIPMLVTCLLGFGTWLFLWRCPACSAALGPLRAHARCRSCDRSFGDDAR